MTPERWFLDVNSSNEILEKSKIISAKEKNRFVLNEQGRFRNQVMAVEDLEEELASRVNRTFEHYLKWVSINLS